MDRKVNHIGIIMDGNRRFARKLLTNPSKGHEWGAKKVGDLVNWCKELKIKQITLYSLSLENFNRPKKEFDYLMNLFRKEFDNLKEDKRIYENKIRIKVLGRTHLLPQDVQEKINYIVEKTKEHANYFINFAIAYGGKQEIVDAVKKIINDVKEGKLNENEIDENQFAKYLDLPDEPDFIIRTGGDHRTSNFLPFQSTYSEWFFIQKMWPEFEKEDFMDIINQFVKRERRFGH